VALHSQVARALQLKGDLVGGAGVDRVCVEEYADSGDVLAQLRDDARPRLREPGDGGKTGQAQLDLATRLEPRPSLVRRAGDRATHPVDPGRATVHGVAGE